MVEQGQDYKINVWDPVKRQGAIEMMLDGTLSASAIDDLPEIEKDMFFEALLADDRVRERSIVEGVDDALVAIHEGLEDRLPAFVPKDRTTSILLGTGVSVFALDLPFVAPVGEILAPTFLTAAVARGLVIKSLDQRTLRKILDNQTAQGYGSWPDKKDDNSLEI